MLDFLAIALGSCYELETQLIIVNDLNFLDLNTFEELSRNNKNEFKT